MDNYFNLVPPCLRKAETVNSLFGEGGCFTTAAAYWLERLLFIGAIVAFAYVVYSGIMMMTAYGNDSKFTEAKGTLTAAIIGVVIMTLAGFIVRVVVSFLTNPT